MEILAPFTFALTISCPAFAGAVRETGSFVLGEGAGGAGSVGVTVAAVGVGGFSGTGVGVVGVPGPGTGVVDACVPGVGAVAFMGGCGFCGGGAFSTGREISGLPVLLSGRNTKR
jgi:hypothetical protein